MQPHMLWGLVDAQRRAQLEQDARRRRTRRSALRDPARDRSTFSPRNPA